MLAQVVIEVAGGGQYSSSDIAHAVALCMLAGRDDPLELFTPRELEAFQHIAGRSVGDIAKALDLSAKTIANYPTSINQKLDARATFSP